MKKSYYPFLLFLWVGLVNETVSLLLIDHQKTNAINSNIYVLIEFFLLLYQFGTWQEKKGTRPMIMVGILGILFWISDNFLLNSLSRHNSLFRCFYSFVILLYSIDRINRLIILDKRNLRLNASFTICLAFVLYYGFKTISEAFDIFDAAIQNLFYKNLWLILSAVNCISNILYTLAILWIPKKQSFIRR